MSRSARNSVLPRHVDLRKFAHQGLSLSGHVRLGELQRVAQTALNHDASALVELECRVDEERRLVISGTVECSLEVACQRCLEPVVEPVHAEVSLAVVWDEEKAKQLPRYLDPLILGEGPTDLYVVIEDELLLSMPIASYHAEACIAKTSFGDAEAVESEDTKANPFQVLEQLKGSPKS